MVTITIPEWVVYAVAVYAIIRFVLDFWIGCLNERIKQETKKLVNNQKLIKELKEKLGSQ